MRSGIVLPEPHRTEVIGIPRGFYSYRYGVLWTTFFRLLGFPVVVSPPTDAKIFDRASRLFEKDLCLPAKVYLAHIESLLDRTDLQLIPQIERLFDGLWSCPKIIAITDLAGVMFGDRLKSITPTIALRSSDETLTTLRSTAVAIGELFGIGEAEAVRALRHSLRAQSQEMRRRIESREQRYREITVGVIAHPYVLRDRRMNVNLLKKLDEAGIGCVTPDHYPRQTLYAGFRQLGIEAHTYWISDFELLGAYRTFVNDQRVDGIIYLNTFGCALDSVLEEYIQDLNADGGKPYIKFVLDEHTLAASFNTKLFAFLDLLAIGKGMSELIDESRFTD